MSLNEISNIVILLSGAIWSIELIPQIIKTAKTKEVGGMSLSFFVMCWIAYMLYIFGNVIQNNWIIVLSHIPSYFCNVIMIGMILQYGNRRINRKKLTEIEKRQIKEAMYQGLTREDRLYIFNTMINDLYGEKNDR